MLTAAAATRSSWLDIEICVPRVLQGLSCSNSEKILLRLGGSDGEILSLKVGTVQLMIPTPREKNSVR